MCFVMDMLIVYYLANDLANHTSYRGRYRSVRGPRSNISRLYRQIGYIISDFCSRRDKKKRTTTSRDAYRLYQIRPLLIPAELFSSDCIRSWRLGLPGLPSLLEIVSVVRPGIYRDFGVGSLPLVVSSTYVGIPDLLFSIVLGRQVHRSVDTRHNSLTGRSMV